MVLTRGHSFVHLAFTEHLQLCCEFTPGTGNMKQCPDLKMLKDRKNHQGPQHLIQTVHMQLTTDPQGGGTPSVVLFSSYCGKHTRVFPSLEWRRVVILAFETPISLFYAAVLCAQPSTPSPSPGLSNLSTPSQ